MGNVAKIWARRIGIALLIWVVLTTTINRFVNPDLSETQLFLQMIDSAVLDFDEE